MAQVQLNTRISVELHNWLDQYSRETGTPKAQLINEALLKLKEEKERAGV